MLHVMLQSIKISSTTHKLQPTSYTNLRQTFALAVLHRGCHPFDSGDSSESSEVYKVIKLNTPKSLMAALAGD